MTMPPHDGSAPLPRARRPWLAPAIACLLAAATLGVLLVPGVLRFPGQAEPDDPAALAALEDGNRALQDEIARLRAATEGGVCVYDGDFYPLDVEKGAGAPPPAARLDLLPPAPAALRPTPDALPPDAVPANPSTPPDEGNGAPGEGAAPPPAAGFDGTIDDLLKRSGVLVLGFGEDSLSIGTGFFVAKDTVFTNAHVVGDAAEVVVSNEVIGAPLLGKVVARTPLGPHNPQPDFALVKLDAPVASALPLSFAPPRRTEAVYASGYPAFFVEDEVLAYARAIDSGEAAVPPAGVVTNGIVTTVQQAADVAYVPHTAGLSSGNSGGPLVDLCGRVVGINTFVTQTRDEEIVVHGDYALASGDILAFLEANGLSAHMASDACAPERVSAPASDPRK